MTYQNDPSKDFNRPANRFDEMDQRRPINAGEGWGTGSIIFASLAAIAVVFGLFYAMGNRGDTSMANRDANRPAVTTTAPANPPAARETTGSSTLMPNNPNGTAPQRDVNQPTAPAPRPSR